MKNTRLRRAVADLTLEKLVPKEGPLWVKSRPFATIPRMSAFGGKAEVSKPACREPHASPPAIARPIKARIHPMGQQ